jgi:hypothetical protein
LALSHDDLLTKRVDPSALPATRRLPATQEFRSRSFGDDDSKLREEK